MQRCSAFRKGSYELPTTKFCELGGGFVAAVRPLWAVPAQLALAFAGAIRLSCLLRCVVDERLDGVDLAAQAREERSVLIFNTDAQIDDFLRFGQR